MSEANRIFSQAVTNTVVNVDANNPIVLRQIIAINTSAALNFVQIFKKPAASVTLGTTVPDIVLAIPASATSLGGGISLNFGDGVRTTGTGFSLAVTTTRTGSTAPTSAAEIMITHGA